MALRKVMGSWENCIQPAGRTWQMGSSQQKVETKLESIDAKRGETIDFITDCNQTVDHDTLTGPHVISFDSDSASSYGQPKAWDSQKDFADSARQQKKRSPTGRNCPGSSTVE
jgi:hypothetical protein